MDIEKKMDEAMKEIEKDLKPGASMVKLGEDGFLKVIIDLNVPGKLFIETRVGAYGTIAWAQELTSRWIMQKEMRMARMEAEELQKQKDLGIINVPGNVAVKGMRT